MQRGDVRDQLSPAQRKMQVIDMKMNDVELGRALEESFQHDEVVRHLVLTMLIRSQRASARSHYVRFRHRISARKKRHIVALSHQLLCEIRYDAFCSPVIFRRYAFIKRRHLCNSHTRILDPSFRNFSVQSSRVKSSPRRGQRTCRGPSILARNLPRLFNVRVSSRKCAHALLIRFETFLAQQLGLPPSRRRRLSNNFARLLIVA